MTNFKILIPSGNMRRRIRDMLLLVAAFCLCSCGFFSIQPRDNALPEAPERQEEQTGEGLVNSSILMGEVVSQAQYDYPVLVIAYPLSFSDRELQDYVILDRAGPFMMYVPEGRYRLYTISDVNSDTFFEDSEVSGVYRQGEEIIARKGLVHKDIRLVTSHPADNPVSFPKEFSLQDSVQTIFYMGGNGHIRKIYDEMFSAKNATAGLWKPSAFMKAYGANIYFMEKYDPEKIPVLFVHGTQGSPQNWVYFLIRLDRTRYQPWFFYYPAGLNLSLSSRILYEKIASLQKKFGFQKMALAAHSMGGLLTRAMLTNPEFRQQLAFIKLYATFATPWSGFESADTAVRYSFKKLPNWYDVGTRSAFGKRVMRARLPDYIRYYLFYGKQDTISKGKALDDRAFVDAQEHFGFPCDHETILSSREVFLQFDKILKQAL